MKIRLCDCGLVDADQPCLAPCGGTFCKECGTYVGRSLDVHNLLAHTNPNKQVAVKQPRKQKRK